MHYELQFFTVSIWYCEAINNRGMCFEVGDIVVPGDKIKDRETDGQVVLGPGLRRVSDAIHATKPGKVCFKEPNIYWVDSQNKRVRTACSIVAKLIKVTM